MDRLNGDHANPMPPRLNLWISVTLALLAALVALRAGGALSTRLSAELAVAVLLVCGGWLVVAFRRYEKAVASTLLLASEQLNRTIDGAPIGLALVGLDGRWLRINSALSTMVGYDPATLMQKTFQDITHPDDLATDLRHVEETIRGERSGYVMEKRYYHRDGHIVPVELHVSLVRDASGAPVHFVSQIVDLTTRLATERALRREEAAFAALVEEADDVIIRYGADHRIRYANLATSRGSGIDPHTLVGHRVEELGLDPELAERWNAALARVLTTGVVESLEYNFPHPDGGPREWQVRFAPERRVDGKPIGVFAVSRDITDLHRVSESLRQREQEFKALVENAQEMIVRYDLAGRYRYANPAALRLLDRSLGEVLGRRPSDLLAVPEAVTRGWEDRNAQAARERRAVTHTMQLDRPDGALIFESSAIPEFDANGRTTSVLVVSRDITAERRATEALQRRELERERLLRDLTASRAALQSIEGLLPTCAWCHRIKAEDGSWERMEIYVARHTEAEFTHGVCPDCANRMLAPE